MGLFIITPDRYEKDPEGEKVFVNQRTWKDDSRDDDAFLAFLGEVVAALEIPTPPSSSETCGVCNYRNAMQEF